MLQSEIDDVILVCGVENESDQQLSKEMETQRLRVRGERGEAKGIAPIQEAPL